MAEPFSSSSCYCYWQAWWQRYLFVCFLKIIPGATHQLCGYWELAAIGVVCRSNYVTNQTHWLPGWSPDFLPVNWAKESYVELTWEWVLKASPRAPSRPNVNTQHVPRTAWQHQWQQQQKPYDPGREIHGKRLVDFPSPCIPQARLCLLKSNSPFKTQPDLTSSRKPSLVECWKHSVLTVTPTTS